MFGHLRAKCTQAIVARTHVASSRIQIEGKIKSNSHCLLIGVRSLQISAVFLTFSYSKSNELKERREYTKLLAKMFSEKDSKLASVYPQLWEAYLDRYSDENDEIRKACIVATSDVLVNHPHLLGQIMGETFSCFSWQPSIQVPHVSYPTLLTW